MNEFVIKNAERLRTGYTTGSCAAAAAKAAACMLLGNTELANVRLTLPSGDWLLLDIEDIIRRESEVVCCVTKDAGDDPDVTHGLKIFARVVKREADILIDGGCGVGRVTKDGLACKIGEAAINPVPRKMIENSLREAAAEYGYNGGFEVEIFVPKGEETAKNTFNARLGILGGISILGTTGIVEPMSEKALTDTIRLEISMKKQDGILFLSPGNYGLEFAETNLGLDIDQAVKCSNYIGEALDYALYWGFRKILLVGHIGKLVKLAAGIMNTHSKTADGRNEIFAAHAALAECKIEGIREIMQAGTTDEIHHILERYGLCGRVYDSICEKIQFHLNYRVKNKIQIELIIFSRESGLLMKTEHADKLVQEIKGMKV